MDRAAASLSAAKNNIIRELFVRSADENYITARWCAANGLHLDFLWLSVHSLEKYLKAALLSNGLSAQRHGHDIVALYKELKAIAGRLLPERLPQPEELSIRYWRERSADQFLAHLLSNGNAENRYLIFGYTTSGEDLHMLDAMVFAIRRLVCALDERYIPASFGPNAPTFSNRERLLKFPEQYGRMSMPLDDAIASKENTPKKMAALNLNLPFAPPGFLHGELPGGSSARNPVLLRRILEPLASKSIEVVQEGLELARWFVANVKVSKDVVAELEQAVADAKARNGLT